MRLFVLCALAALAYHGWSLISSLGFYHDDWSIFAQLEFGRLDGTGRMKALLEAYPNLVYRPFDALLWWAEHGVFGLRPLGWHIVAAALLACVAWLVARLAQRRGASERTAGLAALLFIAWPNKDATVLWPAMSLTLCAALLWLLSEHARLSYEKDGRPLLRAAALAASLASLGFYEQTLFLPLSWLFDPPRDRVAGRRRRGLALLIAAASIAWLAARSLAPRLGLASYPRPTTFDPLHGLVVVASALRVHGPEIFFAAARDLRSALLDAPVGAFAALAIPFLILALPDSRVTRKPSGAGYGLALLVLANLPFVFAIEYRPVPLGPENRLNFLPDLGLALAAAAWWQAHPRPTWARGLALGGVSLLLAASVGAALSWVEASRRQEEVFAAVGSKLHEWPPERELILRLPEILVGGRAPVFASHDSLSYALRLRLGERERRADVLTKRSAFTRDGLVREGRTTPYSGLLLYDAATGTMFLPEATQR